MIQRLYHTDLKNTDTIASSSGGINVPVPQYFSRSRTDITLVKEVFQYVFILVPQIRSPFLVSITFFSISFLKLPKVENIYFFGLEDITIRWHRVRGPRLQYGCKFSNRTPLRRRGGSRLWLRDNVPWIPRMSSWRHFARKLSFRYLLGDGKWTG